MPRLSKDEFKEILDKMNIDYSSDALSICACGIYAKNPNEIAFNNLFRAFSNDFPYKNGKYKDIVQLYKAAMKYQIKLEGKNSKMPEYAKGSLFNNEACYIYNKVYKNEKLPVFFTQFLREFCKAPTMEETKKIIAQRLKISFEHMIEKNTLNKESFFNINHIEMTHTEEKLIPEDSEIPNVGRIILEKDSKPVAYFSRDFDWQAEVIKSIESKLDDIAEIIAKGRDVKKYNFDFNDKIGETISFSFERFDDKAMEVVIKTDERVFNDYIKKNQKEKAFETTKAFAKNNLGFQITTAYPTKNEKSVSTDTRISTEELRQLYPDYFEGFTTPLFRTFAIFKDKGYNNIEFRGLEDGPNRQTINVRFNAGGNFYHYILGARGEGTLYKNSKKGDFLLELYNTDKEKYNLIDGLARCRQEQDQYRNIELKKTVTEDERNKYFSYDFTSAR